MFKYILGFLFLQQIFCSSNIPSYSTLWFEQKVNHFDPSSTKTFKQRVLVPEGQVLVDDGVVRPIFFYTGNEGSVTGFWDNTGFMFDIAPQFDAYIVFAEHRYYGESLPLGVDSFETENLKYLTVEQALADYAVLVTSLQNQLGGSAPVIAFGGSYGGILSAWFRIKYPHIIAGSIASSAPINQVSGLTNQYEFFEQVTRDFRNIDIECPIKIREGFSELVDAQKSGKANYLEISKQFNLCHTLKEEEYETFLSFIQNAFTSLTMCDYPYPADFCGNYPAYPATVSCQYMLDSDNNLEGLYNIVNLAYNGVNSTDSCLDFRLEYVPCADRSGCGLGPGGVAWDYQCCTELTYDISSNGVTDMFYEQIWNSDNFTVYCNETFQLTPSFGWLATEFGAQHLKAASNIVFSNGLLDPWRRGGVHHSISDTVVAIIIEDSAHHLDLRGSNPLDPSSVVEARKIEVEFIKKWISEY